ncbi:hypothetical protein Sjap_003624 [Stephania japonica]|uniref:Uncharacterized protein n=1 Tax=Stephania japonica TaxID=461633 RepID=A0AAP0PVN0_9MAGN
MSFLKQQQQFGDWFLASRTPAADATLPLRFEEVMVVIEALCFHEIPMCVICVPNTTSRD